MTDTETDPYPKTLIGRSISSFWDFIGVLTGSGSHTVRPIQRKLIDALIPALPLGVQEIVKEQLSQPYYMQFWNDGRISTFFFKNFNLTPELRIPDQAFQDCLYKVEMFVDSRKQQARVTFYKGRIHTLQFKQPFKFYEGKDVRFGTARLGESKESYTETIDRLEHGKGGHIAMGE